jgi:hypothetical protein
VNAPDQQFTAQGIEALLARAVLWQAGLEHAHYTDRDAWAIPLGPGAQQQIVAEAGARSRPGPAPGPAITTKGNP